MSTFIKSSEPCPTCLLQNKTNTPLMTRPGQFFTNCAAGHKFEDTEELRMLQGQARAKYPMLYKGPEAPPAVDPKIAFAGRDIVIDPETKQAIQEAANVILTGPGDLKGLLIANIQDNKMLEAENKRLNALLATMQRRGGGGSTAAHVAPNQFVVTIPEWAAAGVEEQANHSGMNVPEWIANEVNFYFENYFGAPARH